MTILKAHNLSKTYQHPLGDIQILNNASFSVEKGESLAVVGESGRGKTTLLYVLAGLDTFEGSVTIKNVEINSLSEKELSSFRAQNIGFVFQHHFLLDDLSAWDNALLPLRIAGVLNKENQEYIKELFDKLGVSSRKVHKPGELSGGERQRVSLIRALALKPILLFADEPTGSLDKANAEILENLLFNLVKDQKTTLIISTHSTRLAERCKRVLPIESLTQGQLIK